MALTYGLCLPQGWAMDLTGIPDPVQAYETMTELAQTAEASGYAALWLVDHFHTIPTPSQEVTFECWTTSAALARDTKRIRIGQLVSCNSYRNPALLAKMASTVDVLSHGRLDFGIGAGWYGHEYHAYGYDFPDGPTRLRQLREAIQVILAMWTEEEATFEGRYYQVRGAINQPKGVQRPRIPLLIGGGGEQVTLKLVAEYGDGCNVHGDPAGVAHKFDVLKRHCETLGRDYDRIRRTMNILCVIADTDDLAIARVPPMFQKQINTALIGSPDTIRKRLAAYEAAGVQELMLAFPHADHIDGIVQFAKEFIS